MASFWTNVWSFIATFTTLSYFSFAAYKKLSLLTFYNYVFFICSFQTRKAALNKSHGSATEFIPILATFIK